MPRYLSTEEYAREVLGGLRTSKTVARWCRSGQIPGARQLPNLDWLVPADALPPQPEERAPPSPPAPERGSLRDLVRKKTRARP